MSWLFLLDGLATGIGIGIGIGLVACIWEWAKNR